MYDVSEQPSRYERSFGGLAGAMIVTVAVVLVFVGWRALFRTEVDERPEPVDWQESVALAESNGLQVVHPTSLPTGWIATSVDLFAGDDPRWGMGVLTDDGDFVGLRQKDASVEELVRTYIDDDARPGPPERVVSPVGSEWETWSDSGGDRGYSTEVGDDTVLVYGSAPVEDLEEFLALLTVTS